MCKKINFKAYTSTQVVLNKSHSLTIKINSY